MQFAANTLPELAAMLGLAGAFLLHGLVALIVGARSNNLRRD